MTMEVPMSRAGVPAAVQTRIMTDGYTTTDIWRLSFQEAEVLMLYARIVLDRDAVVPGITEDNVAFHPVTASLRALRDLAQGPPSITASAVATSSSSALALPDRDVHKRISTGPQRARDELPLRVPRQRVRPRGSARETIVADHLRPAV
jgi:hypothetical protein